MACVVVWTWYVLLRVIRRIDPVGFGRPRSSMGQNIHAGRSLLAVGVIELGSHAVTAVGTIWAGLCGSLLAVGMRWGDVRSRYARIGSRPGGYRWWRHDMCLGHMMVVRKVTAIHCSSNNGVMCLLLSSS